MTDVLSKLARKGLEVIGCNGSLMIRFTIAGPCVHFPENPIYNIALCF